LRCLGGESFCTVGRPLRYLEPQLLPAVYRLEFTRDAEGRVAAVEIPLEPVVAPIRFERLP